MKTIIFAALVAVGLAQDFNPFDMGMGPTTTTTTSTTTTNEVTADFSSELIIRPQECNALTK